MHKTKKEVQGLIEPHFHSELNNKIYNVERVKSKLLLTHNRFDLAFKILYLDVINSDQFFAEKVYSEHIRAFSLGKYTEPGNESKKGIKSFFVSFDHTFSSIKSKGFDSKQTLIPLSENGTIANGSHRVASSIILEQDVDCVNTNSTNPLYDYKFFYNQNVSRDVLDAVATKFIEYGENVFIALIWPSATGRDKEIYRVIPNVVYEKKVVLSSNGALNFITQVYYGEDWLGRAQDGFMGAQSKVRECFKNSSDIRVIVFQASSVNEALDIKEKIRNIFKIEKHSIHITDTKDQAKQIARIVFNDNSLHFLNYASPNKFPSAQNQITVFKKFIQYNNLSEQEVLLDSSLILALYGIRKSNDIDFFIADTAKIKTPVVGVDEHDKELEYHNEPKLKMIYNQKYHFYYNNLKFISFEQLYKMKKNRGEKKDVNDCLMMQGLRENNKFKRIAEKIRQFLYYESMKYIKVRCSLNNRAIILLKFIGLYSTVKFVYRIIVRKR